MARITKGVETASVPGYSPVPYCRPRLALGETLPVRIDQNDLTAVAFLCEDRKGNAGSERRPVATAFFVEVRSEADSSISWDYLVTARHVIQSSEKDTIYVRINRRDGGYEDIATGIGDWVAHESSDVAAILSSIELAGRASGLDYSTIPLHYFIGPGPDYKFDYAGLFSPKMLESAISGLKEYILSLGECVAVGDEIFAPGLFASEHGRKKNLPVARFGHVARMPDEITVNMCKTKGAYPDPINVVAYLVEFLSWGGCSGSPVFWLPPLRQFPTSKIAREYQRVFLGLICGHCVINQDVETNENDLTLLQIRQNAGLAVVIPADAIRSLLMSPKLAQERERREKRLHADRSSVEPDQGRPEGTGA